jgi:hypothetical protein
MPSTTISISSPATTGDLRQPAPAKLADAAKLAALSSLLLVLLLTITGDVRAQDRVVTAWVNIPFAFYAGIEKFPAGDYALDASGPDTLLVRSKDKKFVAELQTIPFGNPVNKEDAQLIFAKRGDGDYFLAQVWGIFGKRVTIAEYGHQDYDARQMRAVKLTFPNAN